MDDGSVDRRRRTRRGAMRVHVKTLTGKVLRLRIERGDTVERMKKKVWAREGIPLDQQRLIFGGFQLEDESLVIDRINEIRSRSSHCLVSGIETPVFHLVLRLTGGANVVFHRTEQTPPCVSSSDESSSSDSESLALPRSSSSTASTATHVYTHRQQHLASEMRDHVVAAGDYYGRVEGFQHSLQTNSVGINGENSDFGMRRNETALNSSPKEGQSIWRILLGAGRDINLIILIIVIAAFLVPKVMMKVPQASKVYSGVIEKHDVDKTEALDMVSKRLNYGGDISFGAILLIIISVLLHLGILYFRVAKEKRSVHVEVIKGGKRVKVTVSDIVDVVPLKIGDKVPNDGILIIGRSVGIHESIN